MWKKPRTLNDCHNIADLRELSKRRLPAPFYHFLEGAAETEYTANRNTSAFDDISLIPRCLVDVSFVDTSTTVLGQDIEWPVICAPTGASRFFHPEGELAVARAARGAGTLYSQSIMSTYSIEAVAAASSGPKMFQLYIFRDRDFTRKMIERCKQSGFDALCLTVDTAVPGNRERDLRTGLGVPPKFTLANITAYARRPGWLAGLLRKGPLSMPNVASQAGSDDFVAHARFFAEQLDPSVRWKDVTEMIGFWDGPFAIKGILSVADARRAVDVGASAIIVSNHGGRQLDGSAATIEVLPDIISAVGHQIEVILDGGIRRGTHVLKALACGAKACSIGRPYLYGLAAGGEAGVTKALHILRTEIERAMTLSGCTNVRDLDEHFVARKPHIAPAARAP